MCLWCFINVVFVPICPDMIMVHDVFSIKHKLDDHGGQERWEVVDSWNWWTTVAHQTARSPAAPATEVTSISTLPLFAKHVAGTSAGPLPWCPGMEIQTRTWSQSVCYQRGIPLESGTERWFMWETPAAIRDCLSHSYKKNIVILLMLYFFWFTTLYVVMFWVYSYNYNYQHVFFS